MALFTFIKLTLVISVLYLLFKYLTRKTLPPGARRLPGPKGLPFIGRVHDVPSTATWMKFWEWSQEYGPIYQMEIFGSQHVWISSEQIANDLLAKRGAIYSDRPMIPNLPDNRTSGDYLALLGRTDTWRRQRKLGHQLMVRSSKADLYSYPTLELKRLLYFMSKDPSNYIAHMEEYTSRTISRLAWGSEEHATELRVGTFGLLVTISPSGAVPNVVAPLRYLPTWMSPWKQRENARHDRENKFFKGCFETVKEVHAKGESKPSYTKMFLEEHGQSGVREEEGQYIVGMMAIAGALTIGSPMQSYILAMCHYPQWQEMMREEMQRVCGDKCPTWEDRAQLPTIRAVVKEVIRWRPPVPTGIPHCLEQDDVYDGYFIPAGATIHALEWGITRDPRIYPDPENFRPDRWLAPNFPTYREPLTEFPNLKGFSQFGFGRRTCQGVNIVEQELFLVMGGLAWAFDIRKKMSKFGYEVPVPTDKYTSLLIAKPEKMTFEMKPISQDRVQMIEKDWMRINDEKSADEGEVLNEKTFDADT